MKAIRTEGLGKEYHVAKVRDRYQTLRDKLVSTATAPARRAVKLARGQATGAAELDEKFWALRDITFDVDYGDVVGFIGRNGAGKSTLLKVLSRITEPSAGFVEIRGRVASLLDVGTGFHPELTGRENIYLNGAILGMGGGEISRKFDEIVDFSGVERFLDTPVKHYSSGMSLRLAFAVAAHLEPEILVIDEVLAVGDASFQRKCIGKMSEVAHSGRTVVFVSHNMGAIAQLCSRAYWLDHGELIEEGVPPDVIGSYLASGVETAGSWSRPMQARSNPIGEIQNVQLLDSEGSTSSVVRFDETFRVEIEYDLKITHANFAVLCQVTNQAGIPVWSSWDTDSTEWALKPRPAGSHVSVCVVPAGLLRPGRYFVTAGALNRNVEAVDLQENLIAFDVSRVGFSFDSGRAGVLTPVLDWEVLVR